VFRAPAGASFVPATIFKIEVTGAGAKTFVGAIPGQTGNVYEVRNEAGSPVFAVTPDSLTHVAGFKLGAASVTAGTFAVPSNVASMRCDATAGPVTLSLPSAATVPGRVLWAKKADASANHVTLTPAGGETIDGAASYVLATLWKYVQIVSDGTAWMIVGAN
jgi:hypothetical protein